MIPDVYGDKQNQAQLARPETSLNFFLTGGLRPPDPPISRPGGLPIWSLTGFGQPNKSLNSFLHQMEKFLEMFHLVQGGRRWYEMANAQGILILGASQRHIRMIPFKCYSETVVYVVSDGKSPLSQSW